jgi:hypothetical protein
MAAVSALSLNTAITLEDHDDVGSSNAILLPGMAPPLMRGLP